MVDIATLVARVIADTHGFEAGMARTQGKLTETAASMRATGRAMTLGLTVPILAVAAESVKFAMGFQTQMEMIHTQAGASQKSVDSLSQAVLKLAPATRYGPEELAKALYHIESVSGGAISQIGAMNLLKVASEGAAVGNANLEDTASALVGTMRVFHEPASAATKVMGELNAIVGAGNMRMTDLNHAIATGIMPTARSLHLGLMDVGAGLALMTDESTPAQVAATRMRTAMLMMTGETKKSRDALGGIGIGALELAHLMNKPDGLVLAMADLNKHLQKVPDYAKRAQIVAQIFGGARSSGTILQFLNNLDMMQQKFDQINRTAGNFPQDVMATQATDAFKMHQAWAAVQTVMTQIGGILAPIVVELAQGFSKFATMFQSLSPALQHVAVFGALAVAALGPLLFIFGALLTPAGAVVAALVGLSAVGAVLYDHFKGVRDATHSAMDGVKGFTDAVGLTDQTMYASRAAFETHAQSLSKGAQAVDMLKQAYGAASPYISNALQVVSHAAGVVSAFAIAKFHEMVNGIKAHTAEIKAFLTAAWNDIVAVAHTIWPYLKRDIEIVWDAIKIIVNTAMKVIGNVILVVMDLISGNWRGAWNALKNATGALLSGIVSLIGLMLSKGVPLALEIATRIGKAVAEGILKAIVFLVSLPGRLGAVITGAIVSVAGIALSAAASIGANIMHGIIGGIEGLAGSLASKLKSTVTGALGGLAGHLGIKSPSTVTRDTIGKPMGEGVIEGFLMGMNNLPSKISASLRTSLEQAKNAVQAQQASLSTAFQRLGQQAVQAFDAATQVQLGKMQTRFDAKVKKMVTDALQKANDALGEAHQGRLDRIDQAKAVLTPTEQKMKDAQDARDEQQRQKAISDAQARLTTADPTKVRELSDATNDLVAAQKDLTEATTDTEKESRTTAVREAMQKVTDMKAGMAADAVQAQADLSSALYDEQVATWQKTADAERKQADANAKKAVDEENEKYKVQQAALQKKYDLVAAQLKKVYDKQVLNYTSERDLIKQHMQDVIDAMDKSLQKHPQLWQRYHDAIMHRFSKVFGPDYKTAGKNLGDGFADGLREANTNVASAATTLAATVARILKLHSPAKEGPLSDLDTWWVAFAPTLLKGLDPSALANVVAGAVTPAQGGAGTNTQAGNSLTQRASDAPLVHIQEQHIHNDLDPVLAAIEIGRTLAYR